MHTHFLWRRNITTTAHVACKVLLARQCPLEHQGGRNSPERTRKIRTKKELELVINCQYGMLNVVDGFY
jgi:hypothetical protein